MAAGIVTERAGNHYGFEGEFDPACWNVLAATFALYDEYLSGMWALEQGSSRGEHEAKVVHNCFDSNWVLSRSRAPADRLVRRAVNEQPSPEDCPTTQNSTGRTEPWTSPIRTWIHPFCNRYSRDCGQVFPPDRSPRKSGVEFRARDMRHVNAAICGASGADSKTYPLRYAGECDRPTARDALIVHLQRPSTIVTEPTSSCACIWAWKQGVSEAPPIPSRATTLDVVWQLDR